MEITLFDWLLIAFLAVPTPFLGIAMHRRLETRVGAGIPKARIGGYGNILLLEWGFLLVTVILWSLAGRSWERLGLGFPLDLGWWIGAALAFVASGFLVIQWLGLRGDEEKLRDMSVQFESLKAMLPHNVQEQRWFGAVSISAGICEEIVYRGFLLGVLSALGGAWVGVVISSVIFGLGHTYQGPMGIAKTTGVGLVMAGLTVLTGSLWAAIFLHSVVDITSGLIAQRVVNVTDRNPVEIGAPASPAQT